MFLALAEEIAEKAFDVCCRSRMRHLYLTDMAMKRAISELLGFYEQLQEELMERGERSEVLQEKIEELRKLDRTEAFGQGQTL